jgi:glutamate-1-semialdehyde aminotransferase
MRVPYTTVANWYEVYPDIICMGKAFGGGSPLSIIAGSKEILGNQDVFVSYTFAGYEQGLINACNLLDKYDNKALLEFYERTNTFKLAFNTLYDKVKIKGYGTRGTWYGDEMRIYQYWQEMLDRGWLLGRAFFPAIDWDKQVYHDFIEDSKQSFINIMDEQVVLRGQPPTVSFRR